MSRTLLFVLVVVFGCILVLDMVQSAPTHHKGKHAIRCEERLYKSLIVMCNHKGNPKILRETAVRCCEDNCILMEMMASCSGKSELEEEQLKQDRLDIEEYL